MHLNTFKYLFSYFWPLSNLGNHKINMNNIKIKIIKNFIVSKMYWKQVSLYFLGLFHKVLAHVLQELLNNYTAYSPQGEFEIWVMVV